MTYKEYAQMVLPLGDAVDEFMKHYCVSALGFSAECTSNDLRTCMGCWNREIPASDLRAVVDRLRPVIEMEKDAPRDILGGDARAEQRDELSPSSAVHHPRHYAFSEHEPIKVVRAWNLNFALGNVVKYIARAGRKDPDKYVEDLEKAAFYLQDEITALRADASKLVSRRQSARESQNGALASE